MQLLKAMFSIKLPLFETCGKINTIAYFPITYFQEFFTKIEKKIM